MSPVSRLESTALSIVLVSLVLLGARIDVWAIAAAVVLVQILVAAAPSLADARGRSIPTPRLAPALAGGLVATALALFPDAIAGARGTHEVFDAGITGSLAGIIPAVALAVIIAAVTQMARSDGRTELVVATSYAVALAVAAALTTGWIGAAESLGGLSAVTVGAASVSAGLLVWSIPGDRYLWGSVAVIAGAAAGAAVPLLTDTLVSPLFGVAVGSGAALFAVLGQILGRALISGRRHVSASWGFPGAMSVAMAAPIVYVGGQLVTSMTL